MIYYDNKMYIKSNLVKHLENDIDWLKSMSADIGKDIVTKQKLLMWARDYNEVSPDVIVLLKSSGQKDT